MSLETKDERVARLKRLRDSLRAQGFDESRRSGESYRVRCSQCEALVINGIPAHEQGCPNGRRRR